MISVYRENGKCGLRCDGSVMLQPVFDEIGVLVGCDVHCIELGRTQDSGRAFRRKERCGASKLSGDTRHAL